MQRMWLSSLLPPDRAQASGRELLGKPAEGLDLAVGVEAEDAAVTAYSAHFEAAEGGVDVGGQ